MPLLDKYLDYVSSVRRYSERTLAVYEREITSFLGFCNGGSLPEDSVVPSFFTRNFLRNYEVFLLEEKKLKASSVNLCLSVLSGFCRFLMKESVLESNPVRLVTRPKQEKRLPQFYRRDSMEEYFQNTENYVVTGDLGMKDRYLSRLSRLIVSILYNTGMRRSELVSLKICDFDSGRKTIRVKGKGDKIREIPILDALCKEISLYLISVESIVGCERNSQSPLIVTEKGGNLYPVYVDRVVKQELGAIRSITGRKSPHVLRHSLATELLGNGTDLYSIKELLGHSSLAATEIYTHNTIEKLKNVYNNAHPRTKKGGKNGD